MSAKIDAKKQRLRAAAERIFAEKGCVSAVDVFIALGNLAPSDYQNWRRGRLRFLERVIQGNLSVIEKLLEEFRAWANGRGLNASITAYVSHTRDRHQLRFSASGNPVVEERWSTHYVSPTLSEKKKERVFKAVTSPEAVVFIVVTDRQCVECGAPLRKGSLLFLNAEKALCMCCAQLDHLVFCASGNAKLTLRARKYSSLSPVVVRFSRTRKRYERQGVLVEVKALEKAARELQSSKE